RRNTIFSRDWSSDVCSSDLWLLGHQSRSAHQLLNHGQYLPAQHEAAFGPVLLRLSGILILHLNLPQSPQNPNAVKADLKYNILQIGRASCRERVKKLVTNVR